MFYDIPGVGHVVNLRLVTDINYNADHTNEGGYYVYIHISNKRTLSCYLSTDELADLLGKLYSIT